MTTIRVLQLTHGAPQDAFDELLGGARGALSPAFGAEHGEDYGPQSAAVHRFIAGLRRLESPLPEPGWVADALDGIDPLCSLEPALRGARQTQFYEALKAAALAFAGTEPNLATRMRALKSGLYLAFCPDALSGAERDMLALAWRAYFPGSPDLSRLG